MKKLLFLQVLVFMTVVALADHYKQQTEFELNSGLESKETYVYEASSCVKLLDGFKYKPQSGHSFSAYINRYGVFPPEAGMLGGPSPSFHDGVVGALPGTLNVSDLGGAVYSIPIQLPKGLGNMMPNLAVTYNNQMGNGLLGWGWDISGLSSIVRCGGALYYDGYTSRVKYNTNDRFMMDGKRLLHDSSLPYISNGATYKTEADEMSKVVLMPNDNGPNYFMVYKADGTIWEYGNTVDSYIEPQGMENVAMSWLVNKISDRDGNSVVFHYNENHETGEFYVSDIEYTMNEQCGIKSMYDVEFIYKNRDDVEELYEYQNIVRRSKLLKNIIVKDANTGKELFNYSFTYQVPGMYDGCYFGYNRLQTIGLTAGDLKLNPTRILWNVKGKHYGKKFISYSLDNGVFNKVPFVGDFNGDGISDVLLVPYKRGIMYESNVSAELYINNGDGTFEDKPRFVFSFECDLEWIYVVDVNGDGLDDVVPYFCDCGKGDQCGSRVDFYVNNGNDTFAGYRGYSTDEVFYVYPGDFFGNKKTAFLVACNYIEGHEEDGFHPMIMYFENGTCYTQNVYGLPVYYSSGFIYPKEVVVEDIDGDSRQELICLGNEASVVSNINLVDGEYKCVHRYFDVNLTAEDILFPGDYNGDGNVDFIKYSPKTGWTGVMSNGDRLLKHVSCVYSELFNGVSLMPKDRYKCSLRTLEHHSVTIRTADFDGDGKCDIGVFKFTAGNAYLILGTNMYMNKSGKYDFKYVSRYYLYINYHHQYVHVGNFLGQENVSVLGTVKPSPMNYDVPKIVSLYPHSAKFSVERITDGLGNVHGFAYGNLIPRKGNYTYSFDYEWPMSKVKSVCSPLRVLRSDTVYSTNIKPCRNDYHYTNALYHLDGKGIIGFQKTQVREYVNGKQVKKKINTNELTTMNGNYMPLLSEVLVYDSDNNLCIKEDLNYMKYACTKNSKIVMPLIVNSKKVYYDYGGSKEVVKVEINENTYQTDASSGKYENYVNVVDGRIGYCCNSNVDDVNECDFINSTMYNYQNDADNWIVNRISSLRRMKGAKNDNPIGQIEMYEYEDHFNPLRITTKKSIPDISWNSNDPETIITKYSYDAVGNIVEQTVSSPSLPYNRHSKVEYSSKYNYLFPTKIVNEKNWETEMSYNDSYGLSRKSVDYNGFEIDDTDDIFGVTSVSSLPDGMKKILTKRWSSGNKYAPSKSMYYCWEKSTGNAESMVFYHRNGKELRNVTFDLYGKPIYVDLKYDNYGNVSSRTLPYSPGDDVKEISFVYDKYNRIKEEIFPNGLRHEYSYDKLEKTMTTVSPNGDCQTKKEKYNVMGWIVESTDIGGNVVSFQYYVDGKLKSSQLNGNAATIISYEYDKRRRKSKQIDPSSGETLFEYDVFDNLIKTVNAKNGSTTYTCDETGALLARTIDDNKGNVTDTQWIYDNDDGKIGMLKKIIHDNSHIVEYSYDDLLRLTSTIETIDDVGYTTTYGYDEANREKFKTYPSGVRVENQYSNSGFVKSIHDAENGSLLWQTNGTDSFGNITDYQVGNGLKTSWGYDDDYKYLNSIYTTKDGCVFQDYTYLYDDFGNLTNRSKLNGAKVSENFEYDEFNRLVGIKLNGKITGSMVYDDYGNMLSKTINDTDVFFDAVYEDGSYTMRSAKTYVDYEGLSHQITYNAFDKISAACKENVEMFFTYGHDLNRIKFSCVSDGKKYVKVYVGDCEYVNDNGEKSVCTFLDGPAGVFAVVKTDGDGVKSTYYIHKDHQNSWCLITDADCNIVQQTSYDAWGNLRDADSWNAEYNGTLLCDRGFTGHEHILAFGLINMNGRVYDPMMSMMLSPDNNIQNPYFSQNYNRYRYCYNNPLSYNDPSGEIATWLLEGIFWGCMNVISNIEYIDDFGEGALLFAAGFASGCLTHGLGQCSWAVQVICNVGACVIKAGVNNYVKQNDGSYDWDIINKAELKEDVMYALGSGLASSTLNAYIIYPTGDEPGVCLGSLICKDYKKGHILDTAASCLGGNLFARKSLFEGVDFSDLNIDWGSVLPEVLDALKMYFPDSKFVEILGSFDDWTGQFAWLFGGTTDNNGGSEKGGMEMMRANMPNVNVICQQNINAPMCYSSVRSLFLNK